ncbi:uncharacterized protein F5Z01DRAFT_496400 [Emericellopsis atlantica]|uniref:Zn(2)-C6 fungal-type domain-containing protein n=1 Tax=Emericellopsis atlantica TaxID=2614577 RepID=A0A9P8CLB0_9HYPO|nr:uncharacterized protein F5Z01DRAFT_496400 [Emericellopsis atlantica]KAG9249436.1 hypothetical protein F5Z01DRAFT_496400 [Emericellopsis atlantica]
MASNAGFICAICKLPRACENEIDNKKCPFCAKGFGRADVARRHALKCPSRAGRSLPQIKRGRRLRACDSCCRSKSSCDSKVPCARCSQRGKTCTYNSLCTDPAHASKTRSEHGDEANRTTKTPSRLPFLLQSTDPSKGFEDLMAAVAAAEPHMKQTDPDLESTEVLAWSADTIDPRILHMDFSAMLFADDDLMLSSYGQGDRACTAVSPARVDTLMCELESVLAFKPRLRDGFTQSLDQGFFTATHFQRALDTCSRRRQCYHTTFIHWPTFTPDKSPLALLLALVLIGTAYLTAGDDLRGWPSPSLNQSLVELSEKYTFTELKRYTTRAAGDLDDFLPACQAANMIVSLQCSIGTPETRRRMACERQPAVVAAARAAGVVGAAHSPCGETEWTDFVHREACIRLVTSAFTNDTLLTCFFNHPPSMAIAELSGSMPSPNEVWHAESEAEFHAHTHHLEELQGQVSFSEAINALMSEEAVYAEAGLGKLSLSQLHVTVLGFQHVIFNYKASMLPKSGLATIVRALDRWVLLWATALDRIEPHDRKWLGIAKYAPEIALISRKVLETILREQEGEMSYFRRIANYDSSAFHEIVCHYTKEAEASV